MFVISTISWTLLCKAVSFEMSAAFKSTVHSIHNSQSTSDELTMYLASGSCSMLALASLENRLNRSSIDAGDA